MASYTCCLGYWWDMKRVKSCNWHALHASCIRPYNCYQFCEMSCFSQQTLVVSHNQRWVFIHGATVPPPSTRVTRTSQKFTSRHFIIAPWSPGMDPKHPLKASTLRSTPSTGGWGCSKLRRQHWNICVIGLHKSFLVHAIAFAAGIHQLFSYRLKQIWGVSSSICVNWILGWRSSM